MTVHELAICDSMLQQVLAVARDHGGRRVGGITVQIGPLAGVEPALLRAAFPLVAAGTVCEHACLEIETLPVRVYCPACGVTSNVRANRLLCEACGAWRIDLVSGEEMLLARVELLDDAHV